MSHAEDLKLANEFGKTLNESVMAFMSNNETRLSLGVFNLTTEPWRLLAAYPFRKNGLTISLLKKHDNINTEIVLLKKSS